MKSTGSMHEIILTNEELYILRDAMSDATVAMRQHVYGRMKTTGEQPSEGAKRRLDLHEALLENLKTMAHNSKS